ncbi:response regulator [Pedobacter arcticus]|uniref:response regulator n=1 Tax=Pedobacter arcticus TaxID=752140 RepID=UPI000306A971|nr:response regulator [Pedobacter arcticus]
MADKNPITMNYRYVVIVVLTFVLLQLIYVSVKRKTVSDQLQNTVNQLDDRSLLIDKIDLTFLTLLNTENSFRTYLNTRQPQFYQDYKNGLLLLSGNIESIQNYRKKQDLEKNINLKTILANRERNSVLIIKLKAINDSLLLATEQLADIDKNQPIYFKPFRLKDVQSILSQTTDTLIKVNDGAKKNLLNRLGDAIANKEKSSTDTIITTNNLLIKSKTSQDSLSLIKLNRLFRRSVKALIANNNNIKSRENDIINANTVLLFELSSLLRELKLQEAQADILYRGGLKTSANNNLSALNRDSRMLLILALILALIIVFNIWRLHGFEHQLKKAKGIAVGQTKQKSAYLAHLSHEIRTPLNAIVGFSDQLALDDVSDKDRESYLNAIRTSSQMLLSLVNDILDFSKLEVGKLTLNAGNFKPYEAVNDVVKTLIGLANQKNLKLTASFSIDKDLILFGDEYRFKQVLINLVNNAIKFTDKGAVIIACKLLKNSIIQLAVSDTGVGIEKKNFDMLFDEFSQLEDHNNDNKKIGTGLGLSITKKIIEAQKGIIAIESEVGKGSTFTVEIAYPILENQQTKPATNKLTALPLETVNWANLPIKKVLIVDDNELNIKILRIILEKQSIICEAAENGEIAYQLFLRNSYDVILTDIQMPILNGVELTKKIRSHTDIDKANIPILAITANAFSEDLDGYLAAGMDGHIVKPFNQQTLYTSLNQLITDKSLLH